MQLMASKSKAALLNILSDWFYSFESDKKSKWFYNQKLGVEEMFVFCRKRKELKVGMLNII
jgi:hypothetical protein